MGHFIASSLCFVLWAAGLNLVCAGFLLGYKRVSGSTLFFIVGVACFAVLLGLGICAHADIAHPFRYAGITLVLGIPLLLRRIRHTEPGRLLGKNYDY